MKKLNFGTILMQAGAILAVCTFVLKAIPSDSTATEKKEAVDIMSAEMPYNEGSVTVTNEGLHFLVNIRGVIYHSDTILCIKTESGKAWHTKLHIKNGSKVDIIRVRMPIVKWEKLTEQYPNWVRSEGGNVINLHWFDQYLTKTEALGEQIYGAGDMGVCLATIPTTPSSESDLMEVPVSRQYFDKFFSKFRPVLCADHP